MEKWFVASKRADFNKIGEVFHISPVTARLMRNRDLTTIEEMQRYLYGSLSDLYDPHLLKDADKGAEIIKEKIEAGKKIRIISDYDVDGVSSNYILYQGLKRCGADVDYKIPDRVEDGYGINEHLIEQAAEDGIDTIITCDNGIAASAQIAYGNSLGLTIVVTDHHDIPFQKENDEITYLLPPAAAVINPKQKDCSYPFKSICGAVVVYKFIQVLYDLFQIDQKESEAFLEIAAMATVCDVMPLFDENRILVREGLRRIRQTEIVGLQALIEANHLEDKKLSSYHFGFILGPCINASGRLTSAKEALELLLCKDKEICRQKAEALTALNAERKEMTADGVKAAKAYLESTGHAKDKVLVVYLPDCHESLAGLVAGRVRENYYRPVFVLTDSEDGVKGSGRSIESYSMYEELTGCGDLLTKFGGHPMAAGLSLDKENVEKFKRRLNDQCTLSEEELTEKESTADEDMRAKLKRFSETYKKLRRQTMDIPMHELLQKVLKETGYARYASALPAGRQRLANLHMLSEKAIAYEKTSYRGLYHFIRYIDELQKYDVDFGEAELVGENEDAVNIMSIHKSKGLEFPVCFVSGMGKSFNKQDSRSKMILHPNLGVGLDIIEEDRRIKVPAFFKKVIARQTELESLGEELRVLYVAFTRAKEKLIITGCIKDEEMLQQIREIYCGSNRKALNFKERAEAKTFLEWILPAAAASGSWDKVSYVTPWSMLEDEAAHQITEHVSLRQRVQQAEEVSDTLYEKIKEQLSYQYPHPDAIHLVTKYSVSELKHRAMRELAAKEEEDVTPKFLEEVSTPYVPAFMEGKAEVNQGALRGTAMHRLMECYDFTKMPDRSDEFAENIKKQLTGLVQMGKVSEDMQKLIRIPSVELFLKSKLAPRMKAAAMRDDLFREKPFVMGNHEMEEEMVLIQGIIDVFWVEEDGIVLLDYKTDRVDSATRLRDMYKEQLDLYAEALERIFRLPVKEKYLYSFRLNQAIEV